MGSCGLRREPVDRGAGASRWIGPVVKYSMRVPTHPVKNADTARVRMVRGKVVIQDLFNIR
jgi:hypothetical protein